MAGANRILKKGEIVFKAGDPGDGMYLIRSGELEVFVEKEGREVSLAKVGAGGMIGEMALFDNQPRSASVKASAPAEVTLISTVEFGKLMRQIPKWFVGLMSALSSRLRQTNERLSKIERSGAPVEPYQKGMRMVHLLTLVLAKDGEKKSKDWMLSKDIVRAVFIEQFGEVEVEVEQFLEALEQHGFLQRKKVGKTEVLSFTNRGELNVFGKFLIERRASKAPPLSADAVDMLNIISKMVQCGPYETGTLATDEIIKEATKCGHRPQGWLEKVKELEHTGPGLQLLKSAGGFSVRTSKKVVPKLAAYHALVATLNRTGLL